MKKFIWFSLIYFVCFVDAFSQEKALKLSVDDIFHPTDAVQFSGRPSSGISWTKDGTGFVQTNFAETSLKVVHVNVLTDETKIVYDGEKTTAALVKAGLDKENAWRIANRLATAHSEVETSFLLNSGTDLFAYNSATDTAKRITNNEAEELEADFSPDGKMVSFVRGNDLYVVDVVEGKETRFTKNGAKNILNGFLSWVYEEELYGRGQNRGYWWSPDSKSIVFLRTKDASVPNFVLADDTITDQRIENTNYPQAGDPNPLVTLNIADIKLGRTSQIDTSKYAEEDFLISRVDWSPDSKSVIYQGQNREQTYLDVNAFNHRAGKTKTLFQDRTPTWIDSPGNPYWLKDGSFVWQSPRDGWKHLYHYEKSGKLIRQITKGSWEVRDFYGVDQKNGYLYFSGTKHSHIGPQIYRIRLDGSGLTRLTKRDGSHRATFNPTFTHFVNTWSDVNTPPQTRLHRANGIVEKVIYENTVKILDKYKMSKPEFMKVKNRHGVEIEAIMIKPPDFDPYKKYPVLHFQYSGPHTPQVRNSWGGRRYIWQQMFAQKGYIIWVLDPRSASGKGEKETWTAYKQLGVTEQLDIEDGVKFLKTLPYVDKDRIGIWGWSYGGYMTLFAMTHSKSFKAGISVAPVTDYRLYDSIYTERYMLTPQNNPDGYAKTDLNSKAKNLHGKLLIVHGIMDNNVHMQNTTKFIYEMQKAGKQFDFMAYPAQRHGIADKNQKWHLYQMMTNFILENL